MSAVFNYEIQIGFVQDFIEFTSEVSVLKRLPLGHFTVSHRAVQGSRWPGSHWGLDERPRNRPRASPPIAWSFVGSGANGSRDSGLLWSARDSDE